MAGKRPGVLMRFNEWRALGALSPERFKRVFLAALNLAEFGTEPEGLDEVETVALSLVRPAIEEDGRKYRQKVEVAKKAAEERWGHAGEDECDRMPADATACGSVPGMPFSSSSSLSDSNSAHSLSNSTPSRPSFEEVATEISRAGLHVDAARFLADCETDGWMDGAGKPIRDWRKWLRGYAALNRTGAPPRGEKKPTALQYSQRHYTEDELQALTDNSMAEALERYGGGGDEA